uniref:NS3 n=1 Tax=uncultured densovirus TaxID=748192 RepID=A0A7L7YTX4_9VIRU|nr:NS3 [uncultured densovirus]
MYCPYDIEDCSHLKCAHCSLCTKGSQVHSSCLKDFVEMSIEDNEVLDLLAIDEEMPTEEQEIEAISIQRNTPLSFEKEMDDLTYKFETTQTSLDFVNEDLARHYPKADFDDDYYIQFRLPSYLSDKVSKFQFFLMYNQWGSEMCYYSRGVPIRMRKAVTFVANDNLCHISCVDRFAYRTAILTVEARNHVEFIELVSSTPENFFCTHCEMFLFDDIEHFNDNQFKIPEDFTKCPMLKSSSTINNSDDLTYSTIFISDEQ